MPVSLISKQLLDLADYRHNRLGICGTLIRHALCPATYVRPNEVWCEADCLHRYKDCLAVYACCVCMSNLSAFLQQRVIKNRWSVGALKMRELLTNKILTTLPVEDFVRLIPLLEPVALSAGESLPDSEWDERFIYFPEDAVISCLSTFQDGSIVEVGMIGKEGLVGINAIFRSQSPTQWTRVSVAGSALRVRTRTLREEFDRAGALRELVLRYASEYMNQISQRAACHLRHRVDERLASWLLMIRDRLESDNLAFTQEMIAQHLGTRRAGITTAALDLQHRHSIAYSRGHITFLNRRALEESACECYPALSRGRRELNAHRTCNRYL